jgi:clan AA aspartic protease
VISGTVNADLEAILRLQVLGPGDRAVQIDAVIDTGFNGYLTLSTYLIETLKLPWIYRQEGELGDGSTHAFDVHVGTVLWNGTPRIVEVELADTVPLLGMAMLQSQNLNIDVVNGGSVSITARP